MAGAWGEYKNSRQKEGFNHSPLEWLKPKPSGVLLPWLSALQLNQDGAFVGVYIPLSGHTSTSSGGRLSLTNCSDVSRR
jgi:hypothetical protein